MQIAVALMKIVFHNHAHDRIEIFCRCIWAGLSETFVSYRTENDPSEEECAKPAEKRMVRVIFSTSEASFAASRDNVRLTRRAQINGSHHNGNCQNVQVLFLVSCSGDLNHIRK